MVILSKLFCGNNEVSKIDPFILYCPLNDRQIKMIDVILILKGENGNDIIA